MRHHVSRLIFSKRLFQRLQFQIKQVTTQHILYVSSNGTLQPYFRYMKTNNENAFPHKFLKIFKGLSFRCQNFVDLKSLWESSDLYELLITIIKTGGLFIRFFAKGVRKLSKSRNEN